MKKYKAIVLSILSASIGGMIVAGILLINPEFLPAASRTNISAEPFPLSNPSTEKELVESMDKYEENLRSQFNSFFNDDFFSQEDPFEALRKFRQRMDVDLKGSDNPTFSSPFDAWFGNKFGGGTVEDIEKREDKNFVYYDIKVKNVKGTTVNTKVENGYLIITGQVDSKSTEKDDEGYFSNQSVYSSSFSRTFPLPTNVEENAMQMDSENGKIVIKFPKTRS